MKTKSINYILLLFFTLYSGSIFAGDIFSSPHINSAHNQFIKQHNDTTHIKNIQFSKAYAHSIANRAVRNPKGYDETHKITSSKKTSNYVNSIHISPNVTINGDVILVQEQSTFVYTK